MSETIAPTISSSSQTYDLTPESSKGYAMLRSKRVLAAGAATAFFLLLLLLLAWVLTGQIQIQTESDLVAASALAGVGVMATGMFAYVVLLLSKPFPVRVRIDLQGIVFVDRLGNERAHLWDSSPKRILLWDPESHEPSSGLVIVWASPRPQAGLSQAAFQGLVSAATRAGWIVSKQEAIPGRSWAHWTLSPPSRQVALL